MRDHDHDAAAGVPPWSVEAESGVLSALLLNNEAWDQVADVLTGADFYRTEHRAIFNAAGALINAGKAADVVTVFEALQSAGTADEAGGLTYINGLAQYVPSAANIRRYAEIVAERAMMRRLLGAADKAHEIATETGLSATERLDRCQNEFQQLASVRGKSEPRPVIEFAMVMLDRIQALADGETEPGIRTRLPSLDRILGGGLKPGKQVVIAARPSVGKSALAMELAYAVADQGFAAGFLSQEMEVVELVDRLTARMGLIAMDNLTTGKLTDGEWTSLTDVAERLSGLKLFVDDQAGLTMGEIQAKARKLKREHSISLLVLDYLQLCTPSDSKASRHHQIEEISRGLKVLAKQLGLTTVILSQLNREVERRVGGRPTLADLKESGAIEEDADVVILLSADGVRENGDIVVHAEVAKNRGGKKGFVKLAFSGRHQRFVETVADAREFQGGNAKPRRSYSDDV
jgi:replicative DNA helicase